MKRKHKRLTFVVIALGLLGVAAGLVLSAFEENIVFFYSPTDIAKNNVAEGRRIRLYLNGQLTVDYTEPDPKIPLAGVIALQIHGGPPSEAWYREITLTELP